MKYLVSVFLIGLLSVIFLNRGYCMFLASKSPEESVLEVLDQELIDALMTPNKGKYAFLFAPEVSRHGLTYCLDFIIYIRGPKCTNIESVQLVHRKIFSEFLQTINSLRIIRPFLAEFPVTPNSLYVNIVFLDEHGKNLYPPYLSSIVARQGVIRIQECVPKDKCGDRKSDIKVLKQIPIPEATWLKDYFSFGVPRSKDTVHKKIPTYKSLNVPGYPILKAELLFAQKFCDANKLEIVITGDVEEVPKDNRPFDFALRGDRPIDLDQARKMAADCYHQFLVLVKNDPCFQDYLKERSTWVCQKDTATYPEPRHLGVRISFWDENIDRQPPPSIAEIRIIGDHCKYFTSDEGQRLVLVHEETFDEVHAEQKEVVSGSKTKPEAIASQEAVRQP